MSGISFAGMGSGIDFDSLREALMMVERQSLVRLTTKQNLLKQKKDAVGDIDTRLDSLKSTISPLIDNTSSNIFNQVAATSSNTSVFTASASSSAAAGTYEIKVKNLALAESVISKQSASVTPFTAGYSGTDLNTIIESNITKVGSLHRRDTSASFVDADLGELVIDDGITGPVTIDISAAITSASTVQDMMNEINNQLTLAGSTVTTSLNGTSSGLLFTSGTGNISIADGVDGKQTATKLGAVTAGLVASPVDGGDLDADIQTDSNLTALNNGAGISDLASGIKIRFGTSSATLDLSTAATVGDVITAINNAGISTTASIDTSGNGFRLDGTITNRSLAIEENGGTTANDLGLFGESHVLKIKTAADASYFSVFLNGGYDGNNADISLAEIRDSINAVTGRTFTSSLVDNRLMIQSNSTGTANVLNLKDNALAGGIFEELGILTNDPLDDTTISNDYSGDPTKGGYLQVGTDAVFSVNGMQITRSQNTGLTDVLDGVTLNLIAPSTSSGPAFPTDYEASTLTIANDTASIADAIESFINQYNSVAELISTSTNVNPDGEDAILAQESMYRNLGSSLFTTLTDMNPDLGYTYRSLFELKDSNGDYAFEISNSGSNKIELNKTALTNILEADPDAVADVLRYDSDANGSFDGGILIKLESIISSYADSPSGVLQKEMDNYEEQINYLDEELLLEQEKLEKKDERLKKQFAAADQLISSLQSQSNYISSQMLSLSKSK